MTPRAKIAQILLHLAMMVAAASIIAGSFLQFGYRAGLIAVGVCIGIYAYLLGAE